MNAFFVHKFLCELFYNLLKIYVYIIKIMYVFMLMYTDVPNFFQGLDRILLHVYILTLSWLNNSLSADDHP